MANASPTSKLVGIFATLAAEHRAAAALLARVLDDPLQRVILWPKIRAELVSHEQGEVRELFPVLRATEALRPLADHHDDEARGLDNLISKLDTLPMSHDAWMVVFQQLVDTVTQHVAEEESRIFPEAQRVLGEPYATKLDGTYADTKAKLVDGHWAPPREPQGVLETNRP
jgi:hypothetical protein